ncbi:MAG: copper chaperone PCu(A)C [Ignavibacteria bacterium]|nr:copper chaperone PCu(A)C [Ignavibacteria bacterium]
MNLILAILFFIVPAEEKIKINDPWIRPSSEGMATALYFTIENSGEEADTLYKVESEISKRVEIHETYKSGDMMGMREVEMIVIQPNSSFELKPGSHHIMVMKLIRDIPIGDRVEFLLHFNQAGEINITAEARK